MSLTDVPYTVYYYNDRDNPVNISKYVNSVNTKRQGSGRIRTATLMLEANDGKFITQPSAGGTPLIAQFDKIKIVWDDGVHAIQYAIYEVDQILKQLDVKGKVVLPLELKGRERAVQDIKTQAFYKAANQPSDPNSVIANLIFRYNGQRGTDQPIVFLFDPDTLDSFNLAPKTVVNDYDFASGISYYDALMHVVTRLSQPTGLGGTDDFWSMIFEDAVDPFADEDVLVCKIFPQGTAINTIGPPSPPVIKSTETDPIHEITTQINTPVGTQVFVRGTPNTSTLPPDLHRYISAVEMINNLPNYISSATYIPGIRINFGGTIYEAIDDVPTSTPPPNATYWAAKTPNDIIGPLNYSLWTKQKSAVTKNSCSNPDHPFLTDDFDSPAFPDGNLVIRDRYDPESGEYKFYRDFAWVRSKDDQDIKDDSRMKKYLMTVQNSFVTFFYKGFTVLVDTSLGVRGGAFVGNDRYGRSFENAIAQYDGTEWIVIRRPEKGDQCCILSEGRTYEWNVPPSIANIAAYGQAHSYPGYPEKQRDASGTLGWKDISQTASGNDAFHFPMSIESVQGLTISKNNGLDYSDYVSESALKIKYKYEPGQVAYKAVRGLLDKIYQAAVKFGEGLLEGKLTTDFDFEPTETDQLILTDFYNYGWWYALPFPYPFSSFNGIQEQVGELYGGGPATADTFAALDIQNANYSHSGLTGWNHDEVSDMGSPTTGLKFWFLFDILIAGIRQPFQGNIPFTITVYDDLRQVWRVDFTQRLLGEPQEVLLPWSQFTVTRPSRTPIGIDSLARIIENIAVPELEIRSIFEERRVRLITTQLAQAYDEHLRYVPVSIDRLVRTIGGQVAVEFHGTIDGVVLTKQPFVSSGIENTRVINPNVIEASNVRNYNQLLSIALAQNDIAGFPFEQFTVVMDGKCNLDVEQFVYLQDKDLINEEDKPATPNTRKLILMADELSWDDIRGFIRTMTLVRRLEQIPHIMPDAPEMFINISIEGHENVLLYWTTPPFTENFLLEIKRPGGAFNTAFPIDVGIATETQFAAEEAGEYSFRIRAKNAFGISPYSNIVSFTFVLPEAPIMDIDISIPGPENVLLSWTTPLFTQRFWLEIKRPGGAFHPEFAIDVGIDTETQFAAEEAGEYSFRIRSENSIGLSDYSNVVSFTYGGP